jgi:hypothetical protein
MSIDRNKKRIKSYAITSSPNQLRMIRIRAVFLIALITALMVACSYVIPRPTEDTTYLTLMPKATVFAYRYSGPIVTKMQAAMFALQNSMGGNFGFTELPKVISVEKINLIEAHKRIDSARTTPFVDTGLGDELWFVILEGEIQVVPPGGTLPPPHYGCYDIMFAINPAGVNIGGIACPLEESK